MASQQVVGQRDAARLVFSDHGSEVVRALAGPQHAVSHYPPSPVPADTRFRLRSQYRQHPVAGNAERGCVEIRDAVDVAAVQRPWAWIGCCLNPRRAGRELRGLPPRKAPFRNKSERIIDSLAQRSGVQLDAIHPGLPQMLNTLHEQCLADPPPPHIGIDENHADPRQFLRIARGRRGAGRSTVPLGDETAMGVVPQQPLPILKTLVPAGHIAEAVREHHVRFGHLSQRDGTADRQPPVDTRR